MPSPFTVRTQRIKNETVNERLAACYWLHLVIHRLMKGLPVLIVTLILKTEPDAVRAHTFEEIANLKKESLW